MPLSPSVRKKLNSLPTTPKTLKNTLYPSYSFYPLSYQKWVEKRGHKVVPLDYKDENIYNIINTLDGLLLTGGSAQLWIEKKINIDDDLTKKEFRFSNLSAYARRIGDLIRIVKEINTKRAFPVFGTCLGFEALLLLELEKDFYFDNVDNLDFYSNLSLVGDSEISGIFDEKEIQGFEDQQRKSFAFNHQFGLLVKSLDRVGDFYDKFDVLATAKGAREELGEFVAIVKSKNYPFYGVQFHPEKIEFESKSKDFKNEENIKINDKFLDLFLNNIPQTQRNLNDDVLNEHGDILKNYLDGLNLTVFSEVGPFDEILLVGK